MWTIAKRNHAHLFHKLLDQKKIVRIPDKHTHHEKKMFSSQILLYFVFYMTSSAFAQMSPPSAPPPPALGGLAVWEVALAAGLGGVALLFCSYAIFQCMRKPVEGFDGVEDVVEGAPTSDAPTLKQVKIEQYRKELREGVPTMSMNAGKRSIG